MRCILCFSQLCVSFSPPSSVLSFSSSFLETSFRLIVLKIFWIELHLLLLRQPIPHGKHCMYLRHPLSLPSPSPLPPLSLPSPSPLPPLSLPSPSPLPPLPSPLPPLSLPSPSPLPPLSLLLSPIKELTYNRGLRVHAHRNVQVMPPSSVEDQTTTPPSTTLEVFVCFSSSLIFC